jgi:hypothetical protein
LFLKKLCRIPFLNVLIFVIKTLMFCFNAGVVELADTTDLGSVGESHGGSSPSARTIFAFTGLTIYEFFHRK